MFRSEYDGAEDHDLFLRIGLTGKVKPIHVPLFLYYWRMVHTSCSMSLDAKPEIPERRLWLLDELVPEVYPSAQWKVAAPSPQKGECHMSIHLKSLDGHERPSVLVLVPFKDNPTLTLKCLESIERQRHDLDVQVILINNGSMEPGTLPALEVWLDRPRRNRFAIMDHDGPFNFARMNNAAIDRFGSGKDLLLFLNNDVELKSLDCLQTMAMQLIADEKCGFVGIKLIYPNEHRVQHGGVKIFEHIVGSGYNLIGHAHELKEFVNDEHVVLGVTFACAMTRREVYERLGGLEEVLLPNSFGDVALCARALEDGYRNYYFGTLVGIHHESKTRGSVSEEAELAVLYERHGQTLSYWRLRHMSHSQHHSWPLATPPPEIPLSPPLPLRYKVADRLNRILKVGLGPAHSAMKISLIHSWRLVRNIRPRGNASGSDGGGRSSPIYRPKLLRQIRSHSN